jgi:hypothetical protein
MRDVLVLCYLYIMGIYNICKNTNYDWTCNIRRCLKFIVFKSIP